MRIYVILLLGMCVASCAPKITVGPPLDYSAFPEYTDMDSTYEEPDTSEIVDSTYIDFKSIPMEEGTYYVGDDSVYVPGGVLISDRKAAYYVFYKSVTERYKAELQAVSKLNKTYYEKAREAEGVYQKEIERLRKDCKRSWFERYAGYIGLVFGVSMGLLAGVVL